MLLVYRFDLFAEEGTRFSLADFSALPSPSTLSRRLDRPSIRRSLPSRSFWESLCNHTREGVNSTTEAAVEDSRTLIREKRCQKNGDF